MDSGAALPRPLSTRNDHARTETIGGGEVNGSFRQLVSNLRTMDNKDAEIIRLRELVAELRTALQELWDVQNLAPYSEDPQYKQAVAQAKVALDRK
jgi:hypothetical protein